MEFFCFEWSSFTCGEIFRLNGNFLLAVKSLYFEWSSSTGGGIFSFSMEFFYFEIHFMGKSIFRSNAF
jgi:hypothetical protein